MLLNPSTAPEHIPLAGGELLLFHNWLPEEDAQRYFTALREQVAWEQSTIRIAGRQVAIPRLNAWYGDPGSAYAYSGTHFEPLPWTAELQTLKQQAQRTIDQYTSDQYTSDKYSRNQHNIDNDAAQNHFSINSALLNLYRSGADSVGWHSDNEASLGPRPQIASLSLGASRRFVLKPRRGSGGKAELELNHNSLLLMLGDLQAHWLHAVPKTTRPVGARINVTFRQVFSKNPH